MSTVEKAFEKVENGWLQPLEACVNHAAIGRTGNSKWMLLNVSAISLAFAIKHRWNPRLKITGLTRQQRIFLKTQGEMLGQLMPLVEGVFGHNSFGMPSPAWLFAQIYLEWEVQGCAAEKEATKTQLTTLIQAQNKALTRYEPIFEKPLTRAVFLKAAQLAEMGGEFDKSVYKPFVVARRQVAAVSKGMPGWNIESDRPKALRQGRVSKKVDSESLTLQGFQTKKSFHFKQSEGG